MRTLNLFLLFFFLITNYSLANQCECEVMECIEASKVVQEKNKNVEISQEINLKGFLAKKSGWHPVQERFVSYVIVLEKPVCIYGKFVGGEGPSIYSKSEIVTHLQLASVDKESINKNMNDRVSMVGTVYGSYTAWHITPFIMREPNIKKADYEVYWDGDYDKNDWSED